MDTASVELAAHITQVLFLTYPLSGIPHGYPSGQAVQCQTCLAHMARMSRIVMLAVALQHCHTPLGVWVAQLGGKYVQSL